MFMVGLTLFTIGSFAAGVAGDFSFLLLGRVVQGLGGAIAAPTALSLIANEFEEGPARTRAFGVYAAVSGAGAALGLLLGGILTNYFTWRWVLFVNVPIGILLIIGAYFYVHQSERLRGKIDFVGALLSVAGLVSVVYGFIHVANTSWGNTQTFLVFGGAVVLLMGFVIYELYGTSYPLMPMRIFDNRSRVGAYTVMLVVGAAMFGMFYFVTFFTQGVLGYSPLKTGFAFLPVAAGIGITSQVVARLLPKLGPKPILIFGTSLLTVALLWLSTVNASSSYAGKLLPGMLALAVAMGCNFVPLTVTAVSKVRNTDAGLASALLNVGQQVGGAIGLSVMATVFASTAKDWAASHASNLQAAIKLAVGQGQLSSTDASRLGGAIASSHQKGLTTDQIASFKTSPKLYDFVTKGSYHQFAREIQAHGSAHGFLTGAAFALIAAGAAVTLIAVKKTDLPTGELAAAAH
jgi:EmrB/QacA subfamily drug resistance transporter